MKGVVVLLTSEAGTTLGTVIHLGDWRRGETDLRSESVINVRQTGGQYITFTSRGWVTSNFYFILRP